MQQAKIAKPFIRKKFIINYFSSLLLILQAWLIASIVDRALIHHSHLSDLLVEIAFLVAVMLLRSFISWKQEIFGFQASAAVRKQVRKAFLRELDRRGPIQLSQEKAGAINSLYIEHIESLHGFYADYLPQMSLAVLVPFTIFLAVFPMDWIAALILLVTAPLIPLFMALIGMGVESANQRHFKSLARLSSDFLDKLKGLTTLKLFGQSKEQTKSIAKAADGYRQGTMSVLKVAFLSSGALELFSSASIAIVAVVLGLTLLGQIDSGYFYSLTLAKALFILLLAPEFFLPLRQLGVHYHARAEAIAAATELSRFIQDFEKNKPKPNNKFSKSLQNISIKDLYFSYDNKKNIFENFNIEINVGEKIAISGPSGIGKSTLIQLILGFLQPSKGHIYINNTDLQTIDLESWRQQITYFGQNPHLLPLSIKENIKLADEQASDEAIALAASKAGVMDFARQFPDGLDTVLGEQNLGVSGGQAQRIALARIFLADRPLIILDEPTASLDQKTEERLLQTIKQHCADKTIILISHRQSTLGLAQRVVDLS